MLEGYVKDNYYARSMATGQGACLKRMSRTITMQGFIFAAIIIAEKTKLQCELLTDGHTDENLNFYIASCYAGASPIKNLLYYLTISWPDHQETCTFTSYSTSLFLCIKRF